MLVFLCNFGSVGPRRSSAVSAALSYSIFATALHFMKSLFKMISTAWTRNDMTWTAGNKSSPVCNEYSQKYAILVNWDECQKVNPWLLFLPWVSFIFTAVPIVYFAFWSVLFLAFKLGVPFFLIKMEPTWGMAGLYVVTWSKGLYFRGQYDVFLSNHLSK